MEKKWTAAQTAAMTIRDKTLLVSAAAGSGKTATLTERIIRSLTGSRIRIESVENAVVNAGLVQMLADGIPNDFRHGLFPPQKYRLNASWLRLSLVKCRSCEHFGSDAILYGRSLSGSR